MINILISKKEYENNNILILENTSIKINKGDKILLEGENGSGKTTTLNIIGLLDSTFTGDYYINNKDIKNLSSNEIALIRNEIFGFVFQEHFLIENETVAYNINIPLIYSKKYNTKEKKNRFKKICTDFQLSDLLKKKVKFLSGGEKQRVAIARALINNPEVLILDEPTASLHIDLKKSFYKYIFDKVSSDTTIILVSHDVNFFDREKFKVYKLEDGKIKVNN